MGHDFRHICLVETRKILWLIGVVFATVLVFQFFELPYGSVISSLFSVSNSETRFVGKIPANISDFNMKSNKTNITEAQVIGFENEDLLQKNGNSTEVDDDDGDPEDEVLFENFKDLNDTSNLESGNGFGSGENSSLGSKVNENFGSNSGKNVSLDPNFRPSSIVLPPVSAPSSLAPQENIGSTLRSPISSTNILPTNKDKANRSKKGKKIGLSDGDSSTKGNPAEKEVVSLSDMNDLLIRNRASSHSMKPRWSSAVDRELVLAKSKIENAPILRSHPNAPLYRNISMFMRSYELMEQMLKVYVYKEGDKPIFHLPVVKGIYASEGWFMKLLKSNKQFVTKKPKKSHLFYLPFSSRMLEETLYVPNSHSRKNLVRCLKNYLDVITTRYPFWNRTDGSDHFLVACHDWAPAETRELMANCLRALCNSDIKEGFILGKDVSLPETYVRSPQHLSKEIGGKSPSKRKILAFFAGNMHGYLRPILLKHWENKDPDMKIYGQLPKIKGQMSYIQHMKSSKFCICAKGYEVNSPRVVEAIFYECVPVIISDNFVPPFFEVLNWESFAVFVLEKDIVNLKKILESISMKRYVEMYKRVKQVQNHFIWHARPVKYDIFHMILHSVWYNRVFQVRER